MYEIDFTHPGKIHFIGIGGISMSGFAELLHSMGFTITGSDWHESKITKHLESLGIQVVYGQKEENITKDIDLVVYTAAVKKTNPEYKAAEKLNLPLMERCSYGWAGNEKLFFRHCHCRNTRKNNDHFDCFPHLFGSKP